MLDIMIVDDEYIVREGLRNGIPWREYGYRVIGEAENGEEALEKIQKNCPDILLTDIKMPVMDGLELLKQINELNLNIKVIILTCYDDFQYAQQAIHYGVEEYILKLSSRPGEILKIFERVKKKIHNEQRGNSVGPPCDTIPYFNEELFSLQYELAPCFFIYLEFDDQKLNNLLKTECMESSLLVEANTIFNGQYFKVYRKSQSSFVMYIEIEDHGVLKQMCIHLSDSIKEKHDVILWIGISRLCNGKSDKVEVWINQAKKACEYRFYYRDQTVYLYDEINYHPASFKIDEMKVIRYLENLMRKDMKEYADKMVKEVKYTPVTDFLNYCIEFISIIIRHLKKNDINPPDNLKNLGCILNYFSNFNEYSVLKEEMFLVIESLIDLLEDNFSENMLIIRKVKEIIDKRYAFELTLEQVAKEVNMSYSYVSNLFKTKVGYSFTEYLNIYRVIKAKELLKNGEESVYLVSEKVGYSSPYYFSRVFKKYTNMTPGEYRNYFGI